MTEQTNSTGATRSMNEVATTSNANSNNRHSESPARTIDSHDSTTGSLDTIVDRSMNPGEIIQTAIEQSTNATNHHLDSLTHSQASMLRQGSSDEEHLPSQEQQQHQQLAHQSDAQSHIYSSPVYDEKPPLKLTAVSIVDNEKGSQKPKLITHAEFQQQQKLQDANTLDSRISKKQRFPPEFIKIKDGDGSSSYQSHTSKNKRKLNSIQASTDCCSTFPLQIILGTLQLVLAVSLIALGSLLIVRDASLSTAGCGIWTGVIAAITGSLGVVSIRKTETAFLALSLVCIASSTLALAISGAGVSREMNRMEDNFELLNSNSEISAACGLIFALFLHFIVSVISVYRCAMQLCSSSFFKKLLTTSDIGKRQTNSLYSPYCRHIEE